MTANGKPTENDSETLLHAERAARARLRESFLRAVRELNGEPCSIKTYEQSTLQATFKSWKPDGSTLMVEEMKTPSNLVIKSAILRAPDILAVTFDRPLQLP